MVQNLDQNAQSASRPEEAIRRALRFVVGRLTWILLGALLGTLCAHLYVVDTQPVFESSSLVLIQPHSPLLASGQELQAETRLSLAYYKSQYQLIQSQAVAKDVVQTLSLKEDRRSEFFGLSQPADAIRARISVQPIRESFLMRVKFWGKYPGEVQRLTNEVVKAYIRLGEQRRSRISGVAVRWLTESLPKIRKELKQAENELLAFQKQTGLFALNGQLDGDGGQLTTLRTKLSNAKLGRLFLETRYRQIKGTPPKAYLDLPGLVENRTVDRLVTQRRALQLEQIDQMHDFGPEHYKVKRIEQKLHVIDEALETQLNRLTKAIEVDYEAARAEEKKLHAIVEKTESEMKERTRLAVRLQGLKREVERVRRLYEPLVQRLGEVNLVSTLMPMHIHVVDEAKFPTAPIRPQIQKAMTLGILGGLILGLGLAFLVDRFDDKIRQVEDLAHSGASRLIGYIPVIPAKRGGGRTGGREQVCLHDPNSVASELFRSLRTSVLLSRQLLNPGADQGRVLLMTSAEKGDGKTTVALNLAIVIAQAGRKVLLVDGDLRQPSLHQRLGFDNSQGLGTIMPGYDSLEEAIRTTTVDELDFLGAGPRPAQPSELLGSAAFEELLATLRRRYDWIIIDSPPLLAVTDGVVLSALADGVIQVVRAGRSRRRLLRQGQDLLASGNARQLGVILNGVPHGKVEYSYYYNDAETQEA